MTTTRLDLNYLGKYEIIAKLGEGGMGIVYLGRQQVPARQVALKVARPEILQDPLNRARFIQEANAAALLQHPNIVPIYEVSEAELAGQLAPFIAMAYIQGQTLRERIDQHGPLPLGETTELIRQVGLALDHAHSHNIVHRDLKPSNILIDQTGHTYLTDFGLARDVSLPSQMTAIGAQVGTPEYMSPEQAEGAATLGPPSDIYSLGLVLYEMLTGKLPFSGDNQLAIMTARITRQPVPPRNYLSTIPPVVEDVIMRSLARRPEHRFRSAGTLVLALKEAAGTPPTAPIDQSPRPRPGLDATIPPPPSPPSPLSPPSQPKTMVLPTLPGPASPGTPQSPPPAGGDRPASWPAPNRQGATPPPPPGGGTPWPPNSGGQKQPNRNLLWIGLGAGLLVVLLLAGGGFFVTGMIANQQATATANALSTASAVAAVTGTAVREATQTAQAERATATASAVAARQTATASAAAAQQAATASAEALVAATTTAIGALPSIAPWSGPAIFGPEAGNLEYDADSLTSLRADIEERNLTLEAQVVNPASATWDYGFRFRLSDAHSYRVVLTQAGEWALQYFDSAAAEDDRITIIDSGDAPSLNLDAGAANQIRVIAVADIGLLYINDVFAAQLDLSQHVEPGGAAISAWMNANSGEEGAQVFFKDFSIYAVSGVAITDGQIPHEDDDAFETIRLRPEARDFLLITTFVNPYAAVEAPWDYGVAFRRTREAQHIITIDSEGRWVHWLRTIVNDEVDDTVLADGTIANADLQANGRNTMVVLANGPTGLLYINATRVAELDLSGQLNPGLLDLFTGFSENSEIVGRATGYVDTELYISE